MPFNGFMVCLLGRANTGVGTKDTAGSTGVRSLPCDTGGEVGIAPVKRWGFRLVCNYELQSKCWNMTDFVGDGWYICNQGTAF